MRDRNVEALVAYLRRNSPRFSLAALELQMHAAGHTPSTVAKALERFLAAAEAEEPATGAAPSAPPAAIPPPPADPLNATGAQWVAPPSTPSVRPPVWTAAFGVAAFDLLLGGAGAGLIKGGDGKVAWLGGCIAVLAPLALLLQLLVGLILTAADGGSRAGRAMLYGSLLVLGFAALLLVSVGVYLAATGSGPKS